MIIIFIIIFILLSLLIVISTYSFFLNFLFFIILFFFPSNRFSHKEFASFSFFRYAMLAHMKSPTEAAMTPQVEDKAEWMPSLVLVPPSSAVEVVVVDVVVVEVVEVVDVVLVEVVGTGTKENFNSRVLSEELFCTPRLVGAVDIV